MRLFVALSLSQEVHENLAGLLAELRRTDPKPRWVSPAKLHVTLKFIGHVLDERLACIDRALAAIAAPPFILEFRGLGFFPTDRRPAVFWAGIESPPELAALAGRIDKSLVSCGVPREVRPFAPHLTLARFKQTHLSLSLRSQSEKFGDRSFGKQMVTDFHLVESKLKSTGPEYTTLRSFPLLAEGKNQ